LEQFDSMMRERSSSQAIEVLQTLLPIVLFFATVPKKPARVFVKIIKVIIFANFIASGLARILRNKKF